MKNSGRRSNKLPFRLVIILTALGVVLALLIAGALIINTGVFMSPTTTPMVSQAPMQTALPNEPITSNLTAAPAPTTWYISSSGNNIDGRSWTTAWNELDQIDWSVVGPGDTILLDGGKTVCAYPKKVTGSSNTPESASGGSCGMVYESTLTIGKSGQPGNPITIRLAGESGRSGTAIIFGGRSSPLPYCGQTGYVWQTSGVRPIGINIGSYSNVVVDGTKWSGILVYGHNLSGIDLDNSSSAITIRNVEVYDNGNVMPSGAPDQQGVALAGTGITFERVIIHENGQDEIQSGGRVSDFTLRRSWLYNERKAPDGSFWNECRHSDGIQIYAGGEQSGITIEDSVIGPGFLQGVILGDSRAVIHDVTIRNTLWYGSGNVNIMADDRYPVKARNWSIDRVTSDRNTGAIWHNTYFRGDPSQITITNSIFFGGRSMSVLSGGSYSNNCQYEVGGTTVGTVVDPMYADSSVHGSSSTAADFELAPDSPCAGKGSGITSAEMLIGEP